MVLQHIIRASFLLCIVRPVMWLWFGLRIRHRHYLPTQGPAIIVANHNSHMDVFALLALLPFKLQLITHPAAAADYFLKNKWFAWFALHILNIIPVVRGGDHLTNPLAGCEKALRNNQILILFPEGSRGEAGKLAPLKSGLWYLSQSLPRVPIIPIGLKGTEKIMAKGHYFPLPLFIDVNIGKAMYFNQNKEQFKEQLSEQLLILQQPNDSHYSDN
ncbi:lysophospholipid acyltransferase family protein [Neisseriaceae bacterium ESL0693]|nr:lysophospholipid acyltransferase family protein [Neisseriaceae bacterium ESL0693]